jgi:hypothetical protein
MAIALVSGQNTSANGTGSATAAHFNNTITAGNAIIVAITLSSYIQGVSSVTDTAGNTYNQVGSPYANTIVGLNTFLYVCFGASSTGSANQTVTVTATNGGTSVAFVAQEVSGLASIGYYDQMTDAYVSSGTSITTPSINTNAPNEILLEIGGQYNTNRPYTAGSGYTMIAQLGGIAGIALAYQLVTTTGSYNASMTIDTAEAWDLALFTLSSTSPAQLINVSDSTTTSETYTERITGFGVNDSTITSEVVTVFIKNLAINVADGTTLSESSVTTPQVDGAFGGVGFGMPYYGEKQNKAASITVAPQAPPPYQAISVNDSTVTSESYSLKESAVIISVSDSTTTSETISTSESAILLPISDSTTTSENYTVTPALVKINVSDSTTTSESYAQQTLTSIGVSDSTATSESYSQATSSPIISVVENSFTLENYSASVFSPGLDIVNVQDNSSSSELITMRIPQLFLNVAENSHASDSINSYSMSVATGTSVFNSATPWSFTNNLQGSYMVAYKLNGTATTNGNIFNPGANRLDFNYETGSNKVFVWFTDSTNNGRVVWESANSVYDGNWHLLIVNKTATSVDVYHDASFVGTFPTTLNGYADAGVIAGASQALVSVDNIRIWNRSLSITEINAISNYVIPRSGLALEWLFNEGSGTTTADTSGNNLTGTTNGTFVTDVPSSVLTSVTTPVSTSDATATSESYNVTNPLGITVNEQSTAYDYLTNYIANPSFETGLTGWLQYGGTPNAVLTQDNTHVMFGSYAMKIAASAGIDGQGFYGGTQYFASGLTIGLTYTFSYYIYSPVATTGQQMNSYVSCGSATNSSVNFDVAVGWNRISNTFIANNSTANVYPRIRGSASTNYWIDGVQIEVGSSTSPYIDGNMNNVYWNGTANNSTSTTAFTDVIPYIQTTIVATDSTTTSENYNKLITSSIVANDATVSSENYSELIPNLYISTSDSTVTSEFYNADQIYLLPFVADASVTSESYAVKMPLNLVVSDSTATSENYQFNYMELDNVSDSTTTSETYHVQITNFASVSDSTTTSETLSVAGASVSINVGDTSVTSEQYGLYFGASLSVADSTASSETITALLPLIFLITSDSTATSEFVNISEKEGIYSVEQSMTSENYSLYFGANASIVDSTATSESYNVTLALQISVSDSTVSSESYTVVPKTNIAVSDATVTSESYNIDQALQVHSTDATTTSESLHVINVYLISVSDATSTSELYRVAALLNFYHIILYAENLSIVLNG